jgi:hypothetical protein
MRQALISAGVAAVVCLLAFQSQGLFDDDTPVAQALPDVSAPAAGSTGAPFRLSVSEEPSEDSWVDGSRSTGADDRMLTDAATSVCFLTKVEISGSQGPDDVGTCRVDVDDFTGFWKVTADVPEGSRSEIRCNARCLVWEQEGA